MHYFHADEGGEEQGDGDVEMPGILGGGEVLAVHHQQGGGSHQAHDAGAETYEDALHHRGVYILIEYFADENHQDQGGKHQGEGSHSTAQYSHHAAHPGIVHSGVAAISGTVDADGTGCHLRDGNDIGKLPHSHPMILRHHLSLDK